MIIWTAGNHDRPNRTPGQRRRARDSTQQQVPALLIGFLDRLQGSIEPKRRVATPGFAARDFMTGRPDNPGRPERHQTAIPLILETTAGKPSPGP